MHLGLQRPVAESPAHMIVAIKKLTLEIAGMETGRTPRGGGHWRPPSHFCQSALISGDHRI